MRIQFPRLEMTELFLLLEQTVEAKMRGMIQGRTFKGREAGTPGRLSCGAVPSPTRREGGGTKVGRRAEGVTGRGGRS